MKLPRLLLYISCIILSGLIFSCHYLSSDEVIAKESIDSTNLVSVAVDTIKTIEINHDTIHKLDSTKFYIYLTFDDGPLNGSQNINSIIAEEKAKASVFIVGFNAFNDERKEYIKNYINNPYIEVSNHTYTHGKNKYVNYYKNPEGVLNDLQQNEKFFDIKNKIVRLPGRNVWRMGDFIKNDHDKGSTNTANLISQNDYYIVGWDYEWSRSDKSHLLDNPEKIYNGMLYRLNNKLTLLDKHLVILMHDDMFNKPDNAEKLRKLIRLIQANNDLVLAFTSNYPLKKLD